MPQEAAGNDKLPPHVEAYFRRRGKDPEKLKGKTRKAFAKLTPEQVAGLDAVGTGLEEDGAQPDMYVYAVH
jgi:hypothetical protein